jgi:DNA-binding LytR/AlgR family response regulator
MTQKLKCLIVEDEKPAQKVLKKLIEEHPNLTFEGVCDNAIEASKLLDLQKIDVMFLDVELKGSIDGLDFLRIRKNYIPYVIVTTVRSERAIEGFELDVTHFVEKPLTQEKFNRAVQKVLNTANISVEIPIPKKTDEVILQHILIKIVNSRNESLTKKLLYDDIVYAETDVNKKGFLKIWIVPNNQCFVTSSYILDDFEAKSPLMRIHRSYVINTNYIDSVSRVDKYLYLKNGVKVDIGEKYINNLKAFFDQH